jgi:hypothetical protein
MTLTEHLSNRAWMISKLRAEVVGPDPAGQPCDLRPASALTWEEFRKAKRQMNGEEIIWQDPPTKRYGAGLLYPTGVAEQAEVTRGGTDVPPDQQIEEDERQAVDEKIERTAERKAAKRRFSLEETDDYDVSLANAFRPSAMGISFLADFGIESEGFQVEVVNVARTDGDAVTEGPAGTYNRIQVSVGELGKEAPRYIWLRQPFVDQNGNHPTVDFPATELLQASRPIKKPVISGLLNLEIVVVARKGYPGLKPNHRLITVSLINRDPCESGRVDERCLFQTGIRVKGNGPSGWIRPYPEVATGSSEDGDPLSDERINRLLHRHQQTFAIGHGCAADWPGDKASAVSQVWTDVLPVFESPSTSADLYLTAPDGSKRELKVSMRKLAGLDPKDDGRAEIDQLLDAYETWIVAREQEKLQTPNMAASLGITADKLLSRCRVCLDRMRDGISLLDGDSRDARSAREAFKLANHAMLIAQLRSTRTVREPREDGDGNMVWEPSISNPDPSLPDPRRGYWRAFQIAFLLMSLRGMTDPESADREIVDLIWFPTGGGKTEAYLGLTAFTIFFNRLSGRISGGADVLMRYTLRLLTAQQFQRAALLFCAMEHLRRSNAGLGDARFRIGLWVGGSASPNSREDAVSALKALQSSPDSENPFILLKCPWCGAKFGPSHGESEERGRRSSRSGSRRNHSSIPSVLGYHRYSKSSNAPATVVFSCNDSACEFGTVSSFHGIRPLPIVVVDDDLLEDPPNLVIGTVDKFAMLAWKPEARRIFGIGENGRHTGMPPSLIIQDELHLISGPLGSMVGLYETLVERLCRVNGVHTSKPKIIASTATISRAREQVRHLYARDEVFLFPPSGLDAGDSFFAREARNDNGSLQPGRIYMGVLAPAHGSLQTTEARVFASLLQHAAVMQTTDAGRDPWWSLLCFFNSLRELGSAASMFVADTRDYLRVILDRHEIPYEQIRKLFNVSELTSRIRGDQVPKELERLEKVFTSSETRDGKEATSGDVIDACLASNIIEVGVDITRLSLMAIVGQPKTTSQYIQVSSRVGRDPEKPGLVVVLYGQTKPRDRSHYERFRPYHQRLYAEVEPTSVTPFSPPAVDRALHGVIVAAVRQFGSINTDSDRPDPFPLAEGTPLRELVEEMVRQRVSVVADEESAAVMARLAKRLDEWRTWQPGEYGGFGAPPEDAPLIHPAGSTEPASWGRRSWPTMSSLRNVDASCEAEVTGFFNNLREDN